MRLALLSQRCFHCVDVDEFMGDQPVARRAKDLVGTPCPLCGVAIQHGDLTVVMDTEDMEKIRNGTAIWDTSGTRPPGFEGFFPENSVPGARSGDVAGKLRKQVMGAPSARRKEMCEIATQLLLSAAARGAQEAEQRGDMERARRAYQTIADYGEGLPAAGAAIQLGQIEQQRGDEVAAIRAYRKAAQTSDPAIRAIANLFLGGALEHAGNIVDAQRAYSGCIDCGESDSRAHAAYRLGNLLRPTDPAAARRAYEIVLSHSGSQYAAGAALNLGVIDFEEWRDAEAISRWEYTLANGDERERTVAAYNLGQAWERNSDARKAQKHYRIAVNSPDPDAARQAQERLHRLE